MKLITLIFILVAAASCKEFNSRTLDNSRTADPNNASVDSDDSLSIRNGDEISASDYPAVGALLISKSAGTFICTASLISPQLILTAAHCVDGAIATGLKFIRGSNARDPKLDPAKVSDFRIYPRYDNSYVTSIDGKEVNLNGTGDLAIARLVTPIFDVPRLVLWKGQQNILEDGTTLPAVVGYGNNRNEVNPATEKNEEKGAAIKRSGTVKFTNYADGAESDDGKDPAVVEDAFLVSTPGTSNQMVCHGDSGGPLISAGLLTGVLSLGYATNFEKFCETSTKSYHTSVSASPFKVWLHNQIAELDPVPEAIQINADLPKVGTCTSLRISTVDDALVERRVGQALRVDLSATGSTEFFSGKDCSASKRISYVTFGAADTSKTVFVKSLVAGTSVLTAHATTGPIADGIKSLYLTPSSPAEIAFSIPDSIDAGACIKGDLSVMDAYKNKLNYTTPINFRIAGKAHLYSDASCSKMASTFTAVDTSTSVYVKDDHAEIFDLRIDDVKGPLKWIGKTLAVKAGTPQSIELAPKDARAARAKACEAIYATIKDKLGNVSYAATNVTLSLTTSTFGQLFSDSACSKAASTVLIGTGKNLGIFYFKRFKDNNTAGTIGASDGPAGLIDSELKLPAL